MKYLHPIKHLKTKATVLSVAALLLLAGCNKQKIKPVSPATPTPAATDNSYGVTVNDGMLKFESIQKFNDVMNMNRQAHKKFSEYISKLAGFTSRKEQMETPQYLGKTTTSGCQCDLDDPDASELVDQNFMMQVGEWIVRLNGCDNKFYAQYMEGLSPSAANSRRQALSQCNFSPYTNFYSFSNDYELAEELAIDEEIIHHQQPQERCHDAACSDRMDVAWRDHTIVSFSAPIGTFNVEIPEFRLSYHRGWLNHGTMTVHAELDPNDPNRNSVITQYVISVVTSQFWEKCGAEHTLSSSYNFDDVIDNWSGHPGQWWEKELYYGPRLKAGAGQVSVKIVHVLSVNPIQQAFFYESPVLDNVF